jgi:tetratricopeptide (TPR) repeat protein
MEVDEKLYTELFDSATHAIKEEMQPFLKILHLRLAAKKFESGNHDSGLEFLQKAFNITFDQIMLADVYSRNGIIEWYGEIVRILVEVGKFKLAGEVIERATKIAESLPECRKHPSIFRCHVLKGHIFNEMREYDAAIESLGHALLQLPKLSHDVIDKSEEFECRHELAKAYWFKESYEKALTSYYDALSVVKDISPEGSEGEGNLYFAVAAIASRIKNKPLVVNNLRLAYKMYSKILGRNHPKTELCYIEYARALINC